MYPGKTTALPQVTGKFLTNSNPVSGERQHAVSGGALDHTVVRAGPLVPQNNLVSATDVGHSWLMNFIPDNISYLAEGDIFWQGFGYIVHPLCWSSQR